MLKLKKYNLEGKEVGEVQLDDAFLNVEANPQMVKDYIVALRANARQWSANTKGRSEVVHTTKKPHKQKGTGSARQGSLVTPQFRGGGIVFGPKPKFDQHVRINRKERRLAMQALFADKVKQERLFVLDDASVNGFQEPKTQKVAHFLRGLKIFGRRVLFLGQGAYEHVETEGQKVKVSVHSASQDHFKRSMRNIPKAQYSLAANVNGYDLMAAGSIILTESALKELQQCLLAPTRQ